MPVAFDTYLLISRLQQGQMPLAQAEAVSAALQEALEESVGSLATKADIADVRKDFKQLSTRVTWMIGVYGTVTLLILGKLLLFKA